MAPIIAEPPVQKHVQEDALKLYPVKVPLEHEADYNQDIKWHNAVGLFVLHIIGLYGVFVGMPSCRFTTFIFSNNKLLAP